MKFMEIAVFISTLYLAYCLVAALVRHFVRKPKQPKPDYDKIRRMEIACGIGQPVYPSINQIDALKHFSGFSEWRNGPVHAPKEPSPYKPLSAERAKQIREIGY